MGNLDESSMRVSLSMRDEIVERLSDAILEGALRPGERLNERVLAEMIGVSRPPLREAIRQLESEGLLTSSPRKGSYVRTFNGDEVRELYSLRYAIEAAAAEYVALNAHPVALARLEGMLVEVENSSSRGSSDVIEKDLRFHREIVKSSGSVRLLRTWDKLLRELKLALLLVDSSFYAATFVEKTHAPLMAAIKSQDFERIRWCTQELRHVGDSLSAQWDSFRELTDSGNRERAK